MRLLLSSSSKVLFCEESNWSNFVRIYNSASSRLDGDCAPIHFTATFYNASVYKVCQSTRFSACVYQVHLSGHSIAHNSKRVLIQLDSKTSGFQDHTEIISRRSDTNLVLPHDEKARIPGAYAPHGLMDSQRDHIGDLSGQVIRLTEKTRSDHWAAFKLWNFQRAPDQTHDVTGICRDAYPIPNMRSLRLMALLCILRAFLLWLSFTF